MKKRLLAALLAAGLCSSLVTGCSEDGKNTAVGESDGVKSLAMEQINNQQLNMLNDNYRTCYEVFVYSFYDSDKDGIGDLKGLSISFSQPTENISNLFLCFCHQIPLSYI